jgi:hypothetical protein
VRQSIAIRAANVSRTPTFHRLEQLLGRGGLVILGFGIWWPNDAAKNVGFGLLVLAFAMNVVGMIARRAARKDTGTRDDPIA